MCHPNKWSQIINSYLFNITINYDLWRFGCFFFFLPFSPSTEASEEPLVDLSDVLNTDADILGMLGKSSNDSGASYLTGNGGKSLLLVTKPWVLLNRLLVVQEFAQTANLFWFCLLIILNITFLNNTSSWVLSFVCIVWSVLCLFCLHYFFTHFIWFWVLVGLDFCPFQVDSSPSSFGKGDMAY